MAPLISNAPHEHASADHAQRGADAPRKPGAGRNGGKADGLEDHSAHGDSLEDVGHGWRGLGLV